MVQVRGAMMNKQDTTKLLKISNVIYDDVISYMEGSTVLLMKDVAETIETQIKIAYNLGKASNEN